MYDIHIFFDFLKKLLNNYQMWLKIRSKGIKYDEKAVSIHVQSVIRMTNILALTVKNK